MALFIFSVRPHFLPMRMTLVAVLSLVIAQHSGAQSREREDTIPAPSLRGNLYGDPEWRLAGIYLPPGYDAHPEKRYPVVYLLHGFGGGYQPFLKRLSFGRALDSLISRGALKEMIVVTPDASNRLTGSFFRNSPVTGKWEDFVVKDLVNFVDGKYRTIPSRKARGIAGWSMGGYGALYLAVRHPEMFSAVYALSACCLMPDLPADRPWQQRGVQALKLQTSSGISTNFNASIITALGAIYTPNTNSPPNYVRLPWSGDSASIVDSIAKFWRDTPLEIIRNSSPETLRRIKWFFDAGDHDSFADIPLAGNELHRILAEKGVPHTFEIFRGTHGDRISERVETRLLPFFSRTLNWLGGTKRIFSSSTRR